MLLLKSTKGVRTGVVMGALTSSSVSKLSQFMYPASSQTVLTQKSNSHLPGLTPQAEFFGRRRKFVFISPSSSAERKKSVAVAGAVVAVGSFSFPPLSLSS